MLSLVWKDPSGPVSDTKPGSGGWQSGVPVSLETTCVPSVCVSFKEKRRLAIRNAAQLWEGVRACLELPSTNGSKEDVSPEGSPTHSPAQSNGLAQEPSPEEPR